MLAAQNADKLHTRFYRACDSPGRKNSQIAALVDVSGIIINFVIFVLVFVNVLFRQFAAAVLGDHFLYDNKLPFAFDFLDVLHEPFVLFKWQLVIGKTVRKVINGFFFSLFDNFL